jgi:hypothetical protein
MKKIPIGVIIDDPAPVISVYYEHASKRETEDGRPLVPSYSNDLLYEFCDIVEKRGIKGKFSIVPMPGNKGDIVNGIDGIDPGEAKEWMDTVKARVLKNFSPCPEMLTHHKAVDLKTGEDLPMNEESFSKTQTRETLTPYITKALSLHKEAGLNTIGVTSPWNFGKDVEDEYTAAISKAVYDVTGSKKAWYFLHVIMNKENVRPWIALEEDGRTLVHIPSTVRDYIWETINSTDTSDEYVSKVADKYITADGKDGALVRNLEKGCFPIFNTHWQSLMSNGLGTGLRVFDTIAERINTHLSDRVEWMSFEEIMNYVIDNRESFLK